jgi:O-antigen/teichoic acid export membrane protein
MSPDDISRIYGVDYSSDDITGIYNACYKLAVFMLLSVQMFRMAWQPFFMKYASDADNPQLFGKVFDWFNVFSAGIFLVISLFAVEIAGINVPILNDSLINSRYWSGLSIVPFLMMAYWFQGWFVNFSAGIFIKDQTSKLPGITLVGAIITLSLNVWLVPVLGMDGAAIATLTCYAAMSFILLHYSQKTLRVNYRVPRAIGLMIFCAILVWLGTESDISYVNSLQGRLVLLGFGALFVFLFNKPKRDTSN